MTEPDEPAWTERAGARGTVWFEARAWGYELWVQGDERAGVWRYGFVRPEGAPKPGESVPGEPRPGASGSRASGSTLLYADDPALPRALVLEAVRRDRGA